jgi:ferredoxin
LIERYTGMKWIFWIMAKLIWNEGEEAEIPDGERIAPICEEAGLPFACTEGICGTCIIEVVEGMDALSPMTQEEKDFLGEQDKERLACQCRLQKGCVKIRF